VEVYRLTRRKFAGKDPFDGEGSFLFGGRWSSIDTRVCYAATHRSLAILEYRAHIDQAFMPDDLVIATLEIPDEIVITPTPALPADWQEYPAPASLRRIGDRFIAEGKAALMLVPSVLVPQENDVMLNPLHPDAKRMRRQQKKNGTLCRKTFPGRAR
jgi:RES domain-containing protein